MLFILQGLFLPFVGTMLGSACVFIMGGKINKNINNILQGFAAGVMIAASVWSLIIPAIENSSYLRTFAFLPSVIGIMIGFVFFLFIDKLLESGKFLENKNLLVIAVSLHNLPEGMAVGVAIVAALNNAGIKPIEVVSLALVIAMQNVPEGAIISLPLKASGKSKISSFFIGVFSAIVELFGAIITLIFASIISPLLPYFLSFAAGAMLYVVVEELIPEIAKDNKNHIGTISFALGFIIMMSLDVALG